MGKYSNITRRSLAMLLTAVMIFSVMNIGTWFGVSAGDEDLVTKTDGKIVSENYELSDTEKLLIGSGWLVGNTHVYSTPEADNVEITVDIDEMSISAESYTSGDYVWVPVAADIVANGDVYETVVLTDGEGTYTYDGDAFSVDVKYELSVSVDEDVQALLLNAPAYLKQGIANLDAIADSKVDLDSIATALSMDVITDLMNGISVAFGPGTVSCKFNVATVDAINALRAEMAENDGIFALSAMIAEYGNAESAVRYLVESGAVTRDALAKTYNYVSTISADGLFNNLILDTYLEMNDPATFTAFNMLKSTLNGWTTVVEAANADAWEILGVDIVAEDIEADGYVALDLLVAALGELTEVPEIVNPLLADEATVRYNMSMYDVNVSVTVYAPVATDELKVETDIATSVTLPEGATAADVYAAVEASGILADALQVSPSYVEAHYNIAKTELPEDFALTEDVGYEIIVTPNTYEVTFVYGADSIECYYGTSVLLPKHETVGKAYDYTVNGSYYAEGSLVTVYGDLTIDRAEGKEYTVSDLYTIVSGNYFTAGGKSDKILTSGAIIGNETVSVRYPDNNDADENGKGDLVYIENGVLVANKYPSSYKGLDWAPYTYSIVVDGEAGEVQYFNGAVEVEMPEAAYDRVDVVYALDLSSVKNDDAVAEILGLVATLNEEAAGQKAALDRFAGYTDEIGSVNATMLNMIKGGLTNEALKGVIDNIVANNMNGEGNFKLYDYLRAYNAQGLLYYYKSSALVINEIESLSSNLSVMLDGGANQADIESLLATLGYGEYVEKLENLEEVINQVKTDLKAPNAMVDLESDKLDVLVDALVLAGDVEEWVVNGLMLKTEKFTIDSDQKHTVTITVQGVDVFVNTFDKIDELTPEVIETIIEKIEDELGNYDEAFYESNFNADDLRQLEGSSVTEITSLKVSVTEKEFTIEVEGAEDQTITISNSKINLPESSDVAYRFDYYVNGVKVETVTYTFSEDEIREGKFEVVREEVYVELENLLLFIDKLNDAGNGAVEFALIDNNGEYTVVMKINSLEMGELMGAVQGIAMGMLGSYNHVGLGGGALITADGQISIQTVIDVIMNSGFGKGTILTAIDANGKINNITLAGNVISSTQLGTYGGEIAKSTLDLGNNSENAKKYPLYITLGASNNMLVQARNLLAGRVGNYFDFECSDGSANLTVTMPGKAYEAYLAVLLATGTVDFTNLNEVNAEIAIGFIKDIVDPALSGEVTLKTFTNTLKKFGYDLDLASYETLYAKFCDIYQNSTFTYDEKTGTMEGNISIKGLIDRLNLGAFGEMIAEYNTGIDFSITATLDNLGKDYEALYIDVRADGVTNKAGLTTKLANKDFSGAAVVVLLSDVEGDLVFDATTVLNLNGFTVDGDIVGNGQVVIVDAATTSVGAVTGDISGDVYILGGQYEDTVTSNIKGSYIQNSEGVVENIYFDLVRDEDGNVTVELNAALLTPDTVPDVVAVLIDVATEMLFAEYTSNSFYIEGNKVFDITVLDLVNIVASSDRLGAVATELSGMFSSEDISAIVNMIIGDVTDFAGLAEKVENDEAVLSYDITTGSWNVEVEHVTDGDYLTVNLISGNKKDRTISVIVVGEDEDKQAVSDLLAELGETVDVEAGVDLKDDFADKDLKFDWSAHADIVLDYSDPSRSLLLSILVADGIGAPANADLVAGIKEYYVTGNYANLKHAFDNLRIVDVIRAIESYNGSYDVAASLANLGITDVIGEEIEELEGVYAPALRILAAALRKLDIDRGSRTLGSFDGDKNNSYGFAKGPVDLFRTYNIARGYSLTLDLAIDSASVQLLLFGAELAPELGEPVFGEDEKVIDVYVDGEYIIVDAVADGITVEELLGIIDFYPNSINVYDVLATIDSEAAIVCNGSKLSVIGYSKTGKITDTAEYTIIVLGDVNCNGRNEAGDAALITRYLVELEEFNEVQLIAAMIGAGNDRVDIGDAYLVALKYVDLEGYIAENYGDGQND